MSNTHYEIEASSKRKPKINKKQNVVTFEHVQSYKINGEVIFDHGKYVGLDNTRGKKSLLVKVDEFLMNSALRLYLIAYIVIVLIDMFSPHALTSNMIAIAGFLLAIIAIKPIKRVLNIYLAGSPALKKAFINIILLFLALSLAFILDQVHFSIPFANALGMIAILISMIIG